MKQDKEEIGKKIKGELDKFNVDSEDIETLLGNILKIVDSGEATVNKNIYIYLERQWLKYGDLSSYIPSRNTTLKSQPFEDAAIEAIKLISDKSGMKRVDKLLEALEASLNKERELLRVEKKSTKAVLKIVWKKLTTPPR